MSKLNNISITKSDGTTELVLQPVKQVGMLARFRDVLTTSAMALRPTVALEYREGSKNITNKTKTKYVIPFIAEDDATGAVQYASVEVSFNLPIDAPSAIADELIAGVSELAADIMIQDCVKNGAFPY